MTTVESVTSSPAVPESAVDPEAASAFARRTSNPAIIGSLQDAHAVLRGEAGTRIAMAVDGIETEAAAAAV